MTVVVALCVIAAGNRGPRPPALAVAVGTFTRSLDVGLGCLAVVLAVRAFHRVRRRRRWRRRRAGLPEFLEAAARSLQAGRPLDDAIDHASMHAPGLSDMFGAAVARLRRGLDPVAALAPIRAVDDAEVRLVAAAVELAHAQLGDAERTLVDAARTLRERRLRRSDVAAQSAQANSSAAMMALLPWLGVVVSSGLDLDRAADFTSPGPQRTAALAGACLSLLGVHWSMRLVDGVERLR